MRTGALDEADDRAVASSLAAGWLSSCEPCDSFAKVSTFISGQLNAEIKSKLSDESFDRLQNMLQGAGKSWQCYQLDNFIAAIEKAVDDLDSLEGCGDLTVKLVAWQEALKRHQVRSSRVHSLAIAACPCRMVGQAVVLHHARATRGR